MEVPIQRVFIDPCVRQRSNVQELIERLPKNVAVIDEVPVGLSFSACKQALFLTEQKGGFVQKCPGVFQTVCCNYYVINRISNCGFDCSYCFLQGYLAANPLYQIYMNTEQLFRELDSVLECGRFSRIGTGELSDSLLLDPITGHSAELIDYFRSKPWVALELKTKSTNIDRLLAIDPLPNVVVSWSLNAESIWRQEELGTPSMAERLGAARQVVNQGFPVGFHFDPVVFFQNWQNEYECIIRQLFSAVPSHRIAWISIGTLRLFSEMKRRIYERFPKTTIFASEFITAEDGKIRYFSKLRKEIYRFMKAEIERYGEGIPIYLCMETPSLWGELESELRLVRHFDEQFRRRIEKIAEKK